MKGHIYAGPKRYEVKMDKNGLYMAMGSSLNKGGKICVYMKFPGWRRTGRCWRL